jgi:hypothetical protein
MESISLSIVNTVHLWVWIVVAFGISNLILFNSFDKGFHFRYIHAFLHVFVVFAFLSNPTWWLVDVFVGIIWVLLFFSFLVTAQISHSLHELKQFLEDNPRIYDTTVFLENRRKFSKYQYKKLNHT